MNPFGKDPSIRPEPGEYDRRFDLKWPQDSVDAARERNANPEMLEEETDNEFVVRQQVEAHDMIRDGVFPPSIERRIGEMSEIHGDEFSEESQEKARRYVEKLAEFWRKFEKAGLTDMKMSKDGLLEASADLRSDSEIRKLFDYPRKAETEIIKFAQGLLGRIDGITNPNENPKLEIDDWYHTSREQ